MAQKIAPSLPPALRDYITAMAKFGQSRVEIIALAMAPVCKDYDEAYNEARKACLAVVNPTVVTPTPRLGGRSSSKGKPPFWYKVVTSYDPNASNGYGIKGKFVNESEFKTLPPQTIIVMRTKHNNKSWYNIMKVDYGSNISINLADGLTVQYLQGVTMIFAGICDYATLIRELSINGITPTSQPI